MRLKSLNIQHIQYYSDNPDNDKYKGKIEFFGEKGESLGITLSEDQLAGIVELCAGGIVKAAQEAAQAIVTSMKPTLQIEQQKSE